MKVIVTYKKPFDTPTSSVQTNSITYDNVTNIAYNSSTGIVTITYASTSLTATYAYSDYMFMLV